MIIDVGIKEKFRDPFMLVDNDVYYLYGSTGIAYKNTSKDLNGHWESLGVVVETPAKAIGDLFWAPEVHKYNDAYYMFTSYRSSDTGLRGCAVFKSDSPEGPFLEITNGTLTPADLYCIDGTLYIDRNGDPWMIYSEEYINESLGKIGRMGAAKMSKDLTSFVSEPVELFRADEPSWSVGTVPDGPCMYRCKDGELLMVWSGFEWVDNKWSYVVAISRSDNGDIDGKWTHDDKLLYSIGLSGKYDGGHGMIFKSIEGQLYLSIHAPNYIEGIEPTPFFIPIKEENNTLVWDIK